MEALMFLNILTYAGEQNQAIEALSHAGIEV
jgi:hypothetical protein